MLIVYKLSNVVLTYYYLSLMNQEYIHINKACKKYKKSRQTFYNYMNKNKIRHKKVHNKVFLHDKDIQKILSDTLHIEAPNPIQGHVIDASEYASSQAKNKETASLETTPNIVHETKAWVNDMHTSLITHLDISINDIHSKTNNKIETIQSSFENNNKELVSKIKYLEQELSVYKKWTWFHQFVYGFVLLVSTIWIILYLFG